MLFSQEFISPSPPGGGCIRRGRGIVGLPDGLEVGERIRLVLKVNVLVAVDDGLV